MYIVNYEGRRDWAVSTGYFKFKVILTICEAKWIKLFIVVLIAQSNLYFSFTVFRLKQQTSYDHGALSFVADEGLLSKSIQQFGRIINKFSHSCTDGSERSWEFAGSEVMSCASEVQYISCFIKQTRCNLIALEWLRTLFDIALIYLL